MRRKAEHETGPEYQIKEVTYDNGISLFFAQHLEDGIINRFHKNKYVNIGNPDGHHTIEPAIEDIKLHRNFYNPPKEVSVKFYQHIKW